MHGISQSISKLAAAAVAVFLVASATAHAQSWKPDRAVEVVVFAAPGGGNDKAARYIQRIWHDTKMVGTPSSAPRA